ncbi:MAG: LPS export ABC transporter periplasmic protein LptC [Chlorobium sp.]
MKKVIVLFLHVILMLSGCGDPAKERRSPDTAFIGLNHPVQEGWTIRISLTESGLKRGVIDAGHGAEYRVNGRSEHHLDGGVRVTLFDANGDATTIITAQKAVIHDNQDIVAQGNVVITAGVSENTTVIKTESVKRTANDKMIRSDRFVTISKHDETIRGEGFESDQALKKYRIFRGSGEAFIKQ